MMSGYPFKCKHCEDLGDYDICYSSGEHVNPEMSIGDCDNFSRTENAQWEEIKWEYDQISQQLQAAEQQNKQLQESILKQDKWHKEILGEFQDMEQQNAQLRADLAQRDAECAGYRVTLEDIASGAYTFPSKVAQSALSTSSGKDILENMRVMQELIEAARSVCNLSECDYSYQFMERVIKLREILAKVKGHKNEWGEW